MQIFLFTPWIFSILSVLFTINAKPTVLNESNTNTRTILSDRLALAKLLDGCPENCETANIGLDEVVSCNATSSNGHGYGAHSTYIDIDADVSCTTVVGTATYYCGQFIFSLSAPATADIDYHVKVGNGNSCNGQQDASFFTKVGDGACEVTANPGSQAILDFTMPAGETTISVFVCVNDNARVSVCDVCAEVVCDETTTATCKDLPSIDISGCDDLPAAFTEPTDVFTDILTCVTPITLSYEDDEYSVCGGIYTRTYTLTIGDDEFTCSQTINVTAVPAPTFGTLPGNITLDECAKAVVSDLNYSNCATSGTVTSTLEGDNDCNGLVTETWSFEYCGNPVSHSRTIQLVDKKPSIICADNKKVECCPIGCETPLPFEDPTAMDACDEDILESLTYEDAPRNFNDYKRTWKVTDHCGQTASCSQTITRPDCNNGIFHTGTTCTDFKNEKPGIPLYKVCDKHDNVGNKIGIMTPGVFFYYTYLTATSGDFTVMISQTNDCGLKNFAFQKDQIMVYNPSCVRNTKVTITLVTGGAKVQIKGATAGQILVLSAKFDTKSIQGAPWTSSIGAQCNYLFSCTGSGTTDGSVILENGCAATSAPVLISSAPASISSLQGNTTVKASQEILSNWNVYPNPVSSDVNISGKVNIQSLDIISIQGTMIRHIDYINANNYKLNISTLNSGLYQLRLVDEMGNVQVSKLIKQ